MKEKDGRHRLYLKTPAGWHGDMWREALPCGDGRVGAAVYGAVKEETILVNHEALWHWGKRSAVPDVCDKFLEMKNLIDKGHYQVANDMMAKALLERGYESELYKPCPVGDIRIEMHLEHPFENYCRSLDMESGEVLVTWETEGVCYERRLFVSRAEHVIVYQICSHGGTWDADVYLSLHETGMEDTQQMIRETEGKRRRFSDIPYLDYHVENEDGKLFGISGKVLKTDGIVQDGPHGGITLRECTNALFIWKVSAKEESWHWEERKNSLDCIMGDYDILFAHHRKIHGAFYHSVNLEWAVEGIEDSNEELLLSAYNGQVPEILLEKMWHYGRYLFISGTAPDSLPFNMYGLWGGNYSLDWSHNMANINIQMMYWHCCKGGLADFVRALVNYYMSMLEDFRENAGQMFNMKGIWIPAGTTPQYGVVNQIVPVIVNWISAAGWLCAHFCEYFRYTRDIELLKEEIFPFMMETLSFYKDYLIIGENGFYEIYPSVSPENTPAEFQSKELVHLGHANPVAKNATMDFAILKEFINNLIYVGEILDLDCGEIESWEHMGRRIPPYMQNEEGAVREWMDETLSDFYYHRHISHLYPVFPGEEFSKMGEKEKGAFIKALELRVLGGQTSWSLIHMGAVYARLGRGDDAYRCLKHMCRTCLTNSFYTLHNDYRNMGMTVNLEGFAPIQLDAAVGYVCVIQEMLFQVSGSTLKIIPALPGDWISGHVEGLCFPDGIVEINWDLKRNKLFCKVKAARKTTVEVVLPDFCNQDRVYICLNAEEEWSVNY